MTDRLTEIKARVAEAQTHSARNDPLFSDLEYTLAVIQELTDERESFAIAAAGAGWSAFLLKP